MAQPATNPKIEELRFRLKTDPKSRLFYQLAEELRRAGQFDESERVLRTGLSAYPAYLAAWVSLGRVLRELKNHAGAVDALNKAMQLDPGNVVAARLIADAYLALGDKIEAIKKYKLVHALLPSDETLEGQIAALERELDMGLDMGLDTGLDMGLDTGGEGLSESIPAPPSGAGEPKGLSVAEVEESPFDKTVPPFSEAPQILGERMGDEEETGGGDSGPMAFTEDESPFGDTTESFARVALRNQAFAERPVVSEPAETETPAATEIPAAADVPADSIPDQALPIEASSAPFETESEIPMRPGDAADTLTMADLYARQGLVDEARHIYENILAREPGNGEVRAKLGALAPRANPKIAKLERWLSKVSRREVGRV